MDYDTDMDVYVGGDTDVEIADVDTEPEIDFDSIPCLDAEPEIDFDSIPCLDTEPETQDLILEGDGADINIEDTYEESQLDMMLDEIQNGAENPADMDWLSEGKESDTELERMLQELHEDEDEGDRPKVYVKTYPR